MTGNSRRPPPAAHADPLPPSAGGTYFLLMHLAQKAQLTVGRLGPVTFSPGWYVYVGSAQGPGGLKARIARHHRAAKKRHWHIDYLLDQAKLYATWWIESPRRLECASAQAIDDRPDTVVIAPGFGASDCRCKTHLFYAPRRSTWAALPDILADIAPSLRSTDSATIKQHTTNDSRS